MGELLVVALDDGVIDSLAELEGEGGYIIPAVTVELGEAACDIEDDMLGESACDCDGEAVCDGDDDGVVLTEAVLLPVELEDGVADVLAVLDSDGLSEIVCNNDDDGVILIVAVLLIVALDDGVADSLAKLVVEAPAACEDEELGEATVDNDGELDCDDDDDAVMLAEAVLLSLALDDGVADMLAELVGSGGGLTELDSARLALVEAVLLAVALDDCVADTLAIASADCALLGDGSSDGMLDAVPEVLGDDDGERVLEAVSEVLAYTGLGLALTGLELGLRVTDGDGDLDGELKVPRRRRRRAALMEKFCRLLMCAQPHEPLWRRVVMR